MRYPQIYDGELIIPVMRGYKNCCCDCGAVHRIDFFVVKGKVKFRVWKDNLATAAARRGKRYAK